MLPLEGIRMLDMCRNAVGRFCSMLLGDMGADVISIEAPPTQVPGQASRQPSPYRPEDVRAAAYNFFGRNKKSMVLNLQTDEGRSIFHKLAETADVVLEGYRPGVVKRLGVDYETLRKINERIICCSISGYGQDGPYVGLVGHDINYISMGGALGMIGWPGGPPAIPMNIIADMAGGGQQAAYGILLALMARERTGRGQYVDIAISDGVINLLARQIVDYFGSNIVPRPGTNFLNGAWPNYNVYECKDGKWISVGSLEPQFFANLCRIMGREDFIEHQHDVDMHPQMRSWFAEQFRTRTRDEWFTALQQVDVCAAPVYSLDEALADPQNLHRQMVIEVEAPGVGPVKQLGIAVKLSETPGRVRSTSPVLGQNTDELLESIGYGPEDIARLREGRIVA